MDNDQQGYGSYQGDGPFGGHQNGQGSGPFQGGYQENGYYRRDPDPKHDPHYMTMKDWLITWLLMLIPFANIVLPFVWAFGTPSEPKFQSRKTLFQAYLVIVLIIVVISIIIGVASGVTLLNYIGRTNTNFY